MNDSIITTQTDLKELCKQLRSASVIAFDTEFISENTYLPELCLIQVASDEIAVAVDTLAIKDLSELWELLTTGDQITLVHSGREELRFANEATGKPLINLFDAQIAAGFVGLEYPAGYATLLQKVLNIQMSKGETRTDWRRRPLSDAQLDYALDDVRHLLPLYRELQSRIDDMGRGEWLKTELLEWQEVVEESFNRERWRNVSGSGNLRGRGLAILRELWRWREAEARETNVPAKRVLRDDLMVELSKRQVTDAKRIGQLRGMERRNLKKSIPEIIGAIQKGLDLPEEDWPKKKRRETPPQLTMLGQFLSSAVSSLCKEKQVAASLVGNPTDVRDLIVYRLCSGEKNFDEPPQLCRGWRAELVGHLLADLLNGDMTIRIRDPLSVDPFEFTPRND